MNATNLPMAVVFRVGGLRFRGWGFGEASLVLSDVVPSLLRGFD
jgi:hypothetical protein